jgi:hypothetical protein
MVQYNIHFCKPLHAWQVDNMQAEQVFFHPQEEKDTNTKYTYNMNVLFFPYFVV